MKMKNKIIEICELGQPQSIIHRENEPITELIKTDSLIEELNKQLNLTDVSSSDKCSRCEINDAQSEHTCPYAEEINNDSDNLCDCCSDCEHECCMDI